MELGDSIGDKLRLGKADALLLYVASLQAVILTLSQLFLGSWALVYYPAILLFVAVMPIYVGYVRGAITRDSLVERTRGWLYLIFGTAMYLVVVSVWFLSSVYLVIKAVQMVVFVLMGWLSAQTVQAVGERILNALGGRPDDSALESFTGTGEAAFWMSWVLAFVTSFLTSYRDMVGTPLVWLAMVLVTGLGVAGIWNAERWARLSEKGYVQEKRKIRNGRFWCLGIFGSGLMVSGWAVFAVMDSTDIRSKIGLVVLAAGQALMFASLVLSGKLPRKVRIYRTTLIPALSLLVRYRGCRPSLHVVRSNPKRKA